MEFRAFTPTSFEATKVEWNKQLEAGLAFPADIEQTLSWAGDHLTRDQSEMAYGVFDDGHKAAVGICELVITHTAPKAWVKMLRLRLSPEVEDQIFTNDPAGVRIALDSYICTVIGVNTVRRNLGGRTIKIYGRTQQQVQFLALLSAQMQLREELQFTATLQGRWLVFVWSE